MLGSIGVAAAGTDESSPAGPFGGNLVYPGLTAGVRVMLPVYQPGALLYLGRGYARQGDGNPTGAGIEMSMNVEFSVEVMKKREWGHSSIARPSTAFQDDDAGVTHPVHSRDHVDRDAQLMWICAPSSGGLLHGSAAACDQRA